MEKEMLEVGELLRSWNQCHGAFLQLDGSDLLWNLREQSLVRYWCSHLIGVPVLWAEASPEGEKLGISAGGLWLSLFGAIPLESVDAFAGAAESYARARGRNRLSVGGDEFHFLPGIPMENESSRRLAEAFCRRGFKAADCADFVGAPRNQQSTKYIEDARQTALREGWSLRPLEKTADSEELSAFLLREFPGRWAREKKIWSTRQDTSRAFWNLLRDGEGRLLGFSRLALRGASRPLDQGWTPGAMRLPLASEAVRCDTDSCLGPIGIAASERGRGAGKILLGLSLHELSLRGAELTCIDWTNAYNYYTPLGFEVVRKYTSIWKEL